MDNKPIFLNAIPSIDLSIIIVNWNSKDYLQKCISSILDNTLGIEFEIIVVDSASFDGCGEMLKQQYPQVLFIQSEKNLGFAGANNLGFQNSSGRNLLFLNPDTEVIGTAINHMFQFLDSRADAGAVGCRLLNSDKSIQTSCIQPFPTIVNQMLDIEMLKLLTPKLKIWGIAPLFSTNDSPEQVEVISGACVMVKRNVFEDIEQFSEEYFMYSEDIDLCYKIKKKGYGIFYSGGGAAIIHHGGGSSNQHPVKDMNIVLMRESVFKFFKKTRGEFYARRYKISMTLTAIIRLSILTIIIVLNPIIRIKGNVNQPLRKWKKIFSWSVGNEKWLKEFK
jgi:GT2 family glycosyltransferase